MPRELAGFLWLIQARAAAKTGTLVRIAMWDGPKRWKFDCAGIFDNAAKFKAVWKGERLPSSCSRPAATKDEAQEIMEHTVYPDPFISSSTSER